MVSGAAYHTKSTCAIEYGVEAGDQGNTLLSARLSDQYAVINGQLSALLASRSFFSIANILNSDVADKLQGVFRRRYLLPSNNHLAKIADKEAVSAFLLEMNEAVNNARIFFARRIEVGADAGQTYRRELQKITALEQALLFYQLAFEKEFRQDSLGLEQSLIEITAYRASSIEEPGDLEPLNLKQLDFVDAKTELNYRDWWAWYAPMTGLCEHLDALNKTYCDYAQGYTGLDTKKRQDYISRMTKLLVQCQQHSTMAAMGAGSSLLSGRFDQFQRSLQDESIYLLKRDSVLRGRSLQIQTATVNSSRNTLPILSVRQLQQQSLYRHLKNSGAVLSGEKINQQIEKSQFFYKKTPKIKAALMKYLKNRHGIGESQMSLDNITREQQQKPNVMLCVRIIQLISTFQSSAHNGLDPFAKIPSESYDIILQLVHRLLDKVQKEGYWWWFKSNKVAKTLQAQDPSLIKDLIQIGCADADNCSGITYSAVEALVNYETSDGDLSDVFQWLKSASSKEERKAIFQVLSGYFPTKAVALQELLIFKLLLDSRDVCQEKIKKCTTIEEIYSVIMCFSYSVDVALVKPLSVDGLMQSLNDSLREVCVERLKTLYFRGARLSNEGNTHPKDHQKTDFETVMVAFLQQLSVMGGGNSEIKDGQNGSENKKMTAAPKFHRASFLLGSSVIGFSAQRFFKHAAGNLRDYFKFDSLKVKEAKTVAAAQTFQLFIVALGNCLKDFSVDTLQMMVRTGEDPSFSKGGDGCFYLAMVAALRLINNAGAAKALLMRASELDLRTFLLSIPSDVEKTCDWLLSHKSRVIKLTGNIDGGDQKILKQNIKEFTDRMLEFLQGSKKIIEKSSSVSEKQRLYRLVWKAVNHYHSKVINVVKKSDDSKVFIEATQLYDSSKQPVKNSVMEKKVGGSDCHEDPSSVLGDGAPVKVLSRCSDRPKFANSSARFLYASGEQKVIDAEKNNLCHAGCTLQ